MINLRFYSLNRLTLNIDKQRNGLETQAKTDAISTCYFALNTQYRTSY